MDIVGYFVLVSSVTKIFMFIELLRTFVLSVEPNTLCV